MEYSKLSQEDIFIKSKVDEKFNLSAVLLKYHHLLICLNDRSLGPIVDPRMYINRSPNAVH